ncbi:MAG TPA: YIEGIA family protein [Limnochordia bacterium]|nr:YIEGIA family protein [Limnochordia bacterium]
MKYLLTLTIATLGGFLARFYMLRRDYRQYPSYPQGWAIHLFLGFIGGSIGAIIVPALLEGDYSAVSFLLLAASQFREVRNVERQTLSAMESTEMVKRGTAYIEGIARVFEARNYLAIWVALSVAIISELFVEMGWWRFGISIPGGALLAIALVKLMKGDQICDIATVELCDFRFDGALVVVGETVMMNVGLPEARRVYEERGLAAVIRPNGPNAKATLANLGQMQAIAHDVSSMIGVYMDVGEQEFIPMVRRNPSVGSLHVLMVPSEQDKEAFLAAIRRVPVLEGAIRKPLTSVAGKMVD